MSTATPRTKPEKQTERPVSTGEAEVLSDIQTMPIYRIAELIRGRFRYYAADPYSEAMLSMETLSANYGADSGRSIVLYFLSNAQTWRGDVARRVKAELKRRLEMKR